MASIFMPKDGIVQAWMMPSGSEVTISFTVLLTGTTTGTSVCQQIGHIRLLGRLDVARSVVEVGGEGDLGGAILVEAEVGIFIGPVPARVADDLDGHVGRRNVALQVEQPEGRNGDDDQDQDRDHRPGHLDQRVVGGRGGDRVRLGVELHHHIEQQRQHEERDHGDDRQQQAVVEPVNAFHGRARRPPAGPSARARHGLRWPGPRRCAAKPAQAPSTAVNMLRNFIVTLSHSSGLAAGAQGGRPAAVPRPADPSGDCEPHSQACRNVGGRGKTSLRRRRLGRSRNSAPIAQETAARGARATCRNRRKPRLSWHRSRR